MASDTSVVDPLEGKSPTLFLAAGGLLVVFAANTGARVFADAGISAVHSIAGPAGFFLGLVGLLGLYPALAGRTSLARVAGIVAALPLVGWFLITVFGVGSTVGILPGMSVVFPVPVFPMLVLLTTVLAYVLFGLTSLRAGIHSRGVSIALLVPAVPFLGLIVGLSVLGPVEGAEVAIDTGHVLAYLIVGFALRGEAIATGTAEPAAEATS